MFGCPIPGGYGRASLALAFCFGAATVATAAAPPPTTFQGDARRAHVEFTNRPADTAPVRIVVHLPLHHRADLERLIAAQSQKGSPVYHRFLTVAEFRRRFGVNAADLANVRRSLGASGLRIVATDAQDVTLEGPRIAVERALGTDLWLARNTAGRTALTARSGWHVPAALGDAAIVNLGTAIVGHAHSRRAATAGRTAGVATMPHNELSPTGGYLTSDLKQAYKYPSYQTLNGKGARIGILIDGDFDTSDMDRYFGLQHLPTPKLERRPVDGGAPHGVNDALETELDIQQAGGMAPSATIVHYNIPDLSFSGIYDGFKAIVTDDSVDVVNMSFGGCERYYNGQYVLILGPSAVPATLFAMNDLIAQGTSQGQTFVASSGDYGAIDCSPPSILYGSNAGAIPGVQFPASSPYVTSVGGTNLVTSYVPNSTRSTYVRENAFEDTAASSDFPVPSWGSGGGESTFFKEPFYQSTFSIPTNGARAVPDIAGHMGGCPDAQIYRCGNDDSADIAVFDGNFFGVIGTSAASPDFVGLVALANQANFGRVGFTNPTLYALGATNDAARTYFHDAIPGFNGLQTRPGYDEVTGLGSIQGLAFTGLFAGDVAGDPGTPSNPGPSADPAPHAPLAIASRPGGATVIGAQTVDVRDVPAIAVSLPFLAPHVASAFDGTRGRCPLVAELNYFQPIPYCRFQDFGLAVSSTHEVAVFPDQIALFTTDGSLVPGWPKELHRFFGRNSLRDDLGAVGDACTAYHGCRQFAGMHAAYDQRAGRYWVSAVEINSSKSSIWLAVSATNDANGRWHTYQYLFDDALTQTAYEGAGFGFDDRAVYLSGVQEPSIGYNQYLLAPAYAFVVAADKSALEAGVPKRGVGFSHLTDRGTEILPLAPAQPLTAADEGRGPEFVASTYSQTAFRSGCIRLDPCGDAIVWAMGGPLDAPVLSAARVATGTYRTPRSWDYAAGIGGGTQDLQTYGGVRATPLVVGGRLTFSFESAYATRTGWVDGFKWLEVTPTTVGDSLRSAATTVSGDVVSSAGEDDDFAAVVPDTAGNVHVAYFANKTRSAVHVFERHVNGTTTADRILVTGEPAETFAAGTRMYSGYAAGAYADGRAWFLLPYHDGFSGATAGSGSPSSLLGVFPQ